MTSIKLKIKNVQGLHARPSTAFVSIADKFEGEIKVIANGEEVNGKNVMGLMLLSLGLNEEFTVVANSSGNDEKKEISILNELQYLVEVLKFNE